MPWVSRPWHINDRRLEREKKASPEFDAWDDPGWRRRQELLDERDRKEREERIAFQARQSAAWEAGRKAREAEAAKRREAENRAIARQRALIVLDRLLDGNTPMPDTFTLSGWGWSDTDAFQQEIDTVFDYLTSVGNSDPYGDFSLSNRMVRGE